MLLVKRTDAIEMLDSVWKYNVSRCPAARCVKGGWSRHFAPEIRKRRGMDWNTNNQHRMIFWTHNQRIVGVSGAIPKFIEENRLEIAETSQRTHEWSEKVPIETFKQVDNRAWGDFKMVCLQYVTFPGDSGWRVWERSKKVWIWGRVESQDVLSSWFCETKPQNFKNMMLCAGWNTFRSQLDRIKPFWSLRVIPRVVW